MDSTQQNCLQLLDRIHTGIPEAMNQSINTTVSYFVRISHLYYSQHLSIKHVAKGLDDLHHLKPLHRSIDCVITRSQLEKKVSFLNSKLERMAEICRAVGQHDQAIENILLLYKDLLDSGIVVAAGRAGGKGPMRAAWNQNEETSLLARTVSTLLKLDTRLSSNPMQLPIYDENWPAEIK